MPLSERITRVDKIRTWPDQIPLHYEYTAGVAGEKFLRGVQQGKILGSACSRCGKVYLPPKMYCIDCFERIERFTEVRLPGTISGLTESYVAFDGARLKKPRTLVYVTFRGVTGGLVQSASGPGLSMGGKVVPKFKAALKRTGSLLDFEFVAFSG
jgi:uncharacterized OB-fold protein